MTGTWTFYEVSTGAMTPGSFVGSEALLVLNTPPGCAAVAGLHDHRATRFNLSARRVEAWHPPAPAGNDMVTHHWDAGAQRWRGRPSLAALKLRAQAEVKVEIERIEAGQGRALREALTAADAAAKQDALERLNAINEQIATRRQHLLGIASAADEQSLDALQRSQRSPVP